MDASAAGEGQLEISINEGEVPNHVQVITLSLVNFNEKLHFTLKVQPCLSISSLDADNKKS